MVWKYAGIFDDLPGADITIWGRKKGSVLEKRESIGEETRSLSTAGGVPGSVGNTVPGTQAIQRQSGSILATILS